MKRAWQRIPAGPPWADQISARVIFGLVILVFSAAACDSGRGVSADELTIVVQGDRRELEAKEKALKEREDSLNSEKQQLDKRIEGLAKSISAADVEQRHRLSEELVRARELQGEMTQRATVLRAQKTEVEAKKAAVEAPVLQVALAVLTGREASVAAREARLGEREGDLAQREKSLAGHERALAAREEAGNAKQLLLSQREQGVTMLELQNAQQAQHLDRALREVPKPGVVEAKHKKMLGEIETRGILISDLPAEDQPINAEIYLARRAGDFARAWDLVAELTRVVTHLKLDQRFVEQKMVRLQGARSQAHLTNPQKDEVERMLREVTSAYSDGQYERANKGLNRISAILDAGSAAG